MVHNTTASMTSGTATILPGAPAGYLWRPAQLEDAVAIYELRIAADEADATDVAGSLDEVKRDFRDSWTNSATHSLLGFDRTGELVASARSFINSKATDEYRVHLIGEIHPRHRSRGIGQFLFSWMSDRAKCLLSEMRTDLKKVLFTYCTDTQSDRMELYEKNGFQIVRYLLPDAPRPARAYTRAETADRYNFAPLAPSPQ